MNQSDAEKQPQARRVTGLKERWQHFRQWQRQPHEVAPLSAEEHTCATCGTVFQGNYCPRCGQSACIGRYSFKKAFLLFLDVWGLGNRSMFRTLRDLLLRPGYMIRDYLQGMQMAYFPPFKLFFLLTTLSLLIQGGLNVTGKNMLEQTQAQSDQAPFDEIDDDLAEYKIDKAKAHRMFVSLSDFSNNFPNIMSLLVLVMMSGFLYYSFFRRSPAIPDLRYSEFLVGLVYTSNAYSVCTVLTDFFCISKIVQLMFMILVPLMSLKQLSGFSTFKVLLFLFSSVFFFLFLVIVVFLVIILAAVF
ncbi:MAG: DUF3667 domain-containing protein [Prevotella sp.]|nr:DUF3667 domain-containing protein [Prevotella sp.]